MKIKPRYKHRVPHRPTRVHEPKRQDDQGEWECPGCGRIFPIHRKGAVVDPTTGELWCSYQCFDATNPDPTTEERDPSGDVL